MELPDRRRVGEILGRAIACAAFAAVLYAAAAHLRSDFSRGLAKGRPVQVALLTSPPAIISYNSAEGKAFISMARGGAASATNAARAAQALEQAGLRRPDGRVLYYVPCNADRQAAIDGMETRFNNWRARPLLAADFFSGYIGGRLGGRCNIGLADFAGIVMELSRLEWPDFVIAAANVPEAPQSAGKPLTVEVLNASGHKNMAALVTRQLRRISETGPLKVDVLRFDNYGELLPHSRIIDRSGRIDDASRLARSLGIVSGRIISEKRGLNFTDATVIVGMDCKTSGWKTQEMLP
ncbi:MAG: LytR C-terminal domain-containing protein [Elusimicrobiales bacterium]